ncbi:transcriptional antiterminator, Rof [Shewanella halifaxensis HAW-EB4]|uniref:Transcriptional antiterminator, Rof n=1 Tax=Shewanella halifaxensis (strain HAW-EB4) TaxID=458817 RepID=B0TMP4_SHEHH|nr:Rho-binding antiterminator [Shewanella halifaxensis]ABZ77404.1 transcriptional antiterminator, Rof [Shewanella halifaxensis HAW-EB4]
MISCNQYDYIEIVCLYRYPIALKLKSGETISGIALDTARDSKKRECIKLTYQDSPNTDADDSEDDGVNNDLAVTQLIILDDIASIHVCIDNPHFQSVEFK